MTRDDYRPSKSMAQRPVSLNHPAFGRRRIPKAALRIVHPAGTVQRRYVVALDSDSVQPNARRYDEKGEARLAQAVAVAITGLPLKIIAVHVTERFENE